LFVEKFLEQIILSR